MCLLSTFSTISNDWLTVSVASETTVARAGSISYLKDHRTGTQIVSYGQFSGMNTGPFIPATGVITVTSDTSLVFHTDHFTDGSTLLPLDLTVAYTLVDRGLEMSYRL